MEDILSKISELNKLKAEIKENETKIDNLLLWEELIIYGDSDSWLRYRQHIPKNLTTTIKALLIEYYQAEFDELILKAKKLVISEAKNLLGEQDENN
jgi:hypothetical protein